MNEEDYGMLSENRYPYNDSNSELISHDAEVITTPSQLLLQLHRQPVPVIRLVVSIFFGFQDSRLLGCKAVCAGEQSPTFR